MAIMNCPECGGTVSSSAISCPHCGYGVAEHMSKQRENEEQKKRQEQAHDEIQALLDKIIPCDFTVPEPRIKVCVKCGESTYYKRKHGWCSADSYSDNMCKHNGVEYPLVEIDYPQAQTPDGIGSRVYMQRYCIEPRNIGDTNSSEYKNRVADIENKRGTCAPSTKAEELLFLSPPDPKYFGKSLEDEPKPTPRSNINIPVNTNTPKCPTCGSTNISKISTAARAAHGFAFGLFSSTARSQFKCNACGYKW